MNLAQSTFNLYCGWFYLEQAGHLSLTQGRFEQVCQTLKEKQCVPEDSSHSEFLQLLWELISSSWSNGSSNLVHQVL